MLLHSRIETARCHCKFLSIRQQQRSEAVARIADHTASQQTIYSNQRLLLNSISRMFEILAVSVMGVTTWPFGVTWCHRSRDHSILRRPFHIDGPLERRLDL